MRSVWPEMQEALRDAGWRNYSLFLRPDGLVVGYLEAETLKRCLATMKHQAVNARWQTEMAPSLNRSTAAATTSSSRSKKSSTSTNPAGFTEPIFRL